jgi:hypothetical protein
MSLIRMLSPLTASSEPTTWSGFWIGDVGCGDGRHLVRFAKGGYEMYGWKATKRGCLITSSIWKSCQRFSRFDIVHLHQDRRDYTCMLAQEPHSVLVADGILNTKLSVR